MPSWLRMRFMGLTNAMLTWSVLRTRLCVSKFFFEIRILINLHLVHVHIVPKVVNAPQQSNYQLYAHLVTIKMKLENPIANSVLMDLPALIRLQHQLTVEQGILLISITNNAM